MRALSSIWSQYVNRLFGKRRSTAPLRRATHRRNVNGRDFCAAAEVLVLEERALLSATFDADSGVSHERTEVRNEAGEPREVDLWTGCYTPRELRLLLAAAGFVDVTISSVEPGAYGEMNPTTESAEFLVLASIP